MINILGKQNSIFNQFVAEIRDEKIQRDSMRFRRNLQRVGEIFAYEISKRLNYSSKEVKTPLGFADIPILSDQVVIASILRGGLPIQQGLHNYFDKAENAFISISRGRTKVTDEDSMVEFISSPLIDNKVVILSDALIATGLSMVLSYRALLAKGTPRHIHIASIIASEEGVEYIKKYFPMKSSTLWIGAIDDELTVKSFIVPGLGDAGDLAYGNIIDSKDEDEIEEDEELIM